MDKGPSLLVLKCGFTSFGTCDLKEDDWGDELLLDRILLCFLQREEGAEEVKTCAANPENRTTIAGLRLFYDFTFQTELS